MLSLTKICTVNRPLSDEMAYDIQALKWRRNPIRSSQQFVTTFNVFLIYTVRAEFTLPEGSSVLYVWFEWMDSIKPSCKFYLRVLL